LKTDSWGPGSICTGGSRPPAGLFKVPFPGTGLIMQCGDGPAKTELDCFCIGVRAPTVTRRIVENGFVSSRKYLESGLIPNPQAMEQCREQGIQEGRVGRVHAEYQLERLLL